ncbi:TolC family protein [Terasakiella sp.]|uniref:TolC family protein n=1 Tax=Terasakiella sp. TaxID=2034861 RepID=UPI003AA9A278
MRKLRTLSVSFLTLSLFSTVVFAQELSLSEAENLTLAADPLSKQFQSNSKAQEELAIAEGQLPDPMISLGALNLPTDTFNTDQEAMTQFQVGITQQIPNFSALDAKSEIASALSRVDQANETTRKLLSLKAVRLSYLEALYWKKALLILEDYRDLVEDDIKSVQASYSSGRISAQRVLAAELASSLLDDRSLDALKNLDVTKANISKWIGENANARTLPDDLPVLDLPLNEIAFLDALTQHPSLKMFNEQEEASKERVKLAEADYAPKFGVGASYGYRQDTPMGQERADLVSFKLTMSIPLFTEKRQDRKLSASKHQAAAARLRANEQLRELTQEYRSEIANYTRTQERLENFETQILKRAQDNVSAAITAYQYEASDFDELVRARVAELEARLKHLRLQIDSSKSLARLQYLQGETL